jgi:glycine dehydrogenase
MQECDMAGTPPFADRHIGPRPEEIGKMLAEVGAADLDSLIRSTIPASIRADEPLALPGPFTEEEVIERLSAIAAGNRVVRSMIGLGYHGTITPPVIKRNILENPAWYTSYTPYQPEISQGRLEALLNFQTMVSELAGMEVANASLLDEGTAAAEAMAMAHRLDRSDRMVMVVDPDCLPQTIAVVRTRAEPLGIEVRVADPATFDPDGVFAILLQYPGASGAVADHRSAVARARGAGVAVIVAADLLALTLLEPPGAWGADIVVGSAQRFGVPMGFGGPHAGYIATWTRNVRALPGRLVGVSVDSKGRRAYRLALQTREQHIRRERATSNVCTAQVLLAVIAGFYGLWHGPEGLTAIAERVHGHASRLRAGLRAAGFGVEADSWFDTITISTGGRADEFVARALDVGINIRRVDHDRVGISCDETTTAAELDAVLAAFGAEPTPEGVAGIPDALRRTSPFMTHPVFSRYRSEHEMLRYIRLLADKDLALDRTMIPLGSCTMKLNATTEMIPITWPEFADLHPFAPSDQTRGYARLIGELESMLVEVTGYDAVSLQPNAGSQGEFAGLLAIRAYHRSRGHDRRDVCLIPSSAHGTNAASAVMAGLRVVVVGCDERGNVDLADLRTKLDEHQDRVAAIMVTYPSTHGVFEEGIVEVCDVVHAAGGQVYVDGANLNALVGTAKPGWFGADVSHLNLHKTFTIPHGGGGPGVGPIGVKAHLAPFLPNHPLRTDAGPVTGVGPISSAPWGSAGILPIPWVYLMLMGPDGLRRATQAAILAANYVAHRVSTAFPILYTGAGDRVAHECIVDVRPLTKETGITAEDVAKRLADYGFHAPTLSFPVAGTLMVEPTESESLQELDRFCDAMLAIRAEIDRVAAGEWPADDNPLVNAPHTVEDIAGEWSHPYSRWEALYPVDGLRGRVYVTPVSRIDGAAGDRHLVCACPPMEAYATD